MSESIDSSSTTKACPSPITPKDAALYEAGRLMFVNANDVGREFCKYMTNTSFAAIPVYLALVTFGLSEDVEIGVELRMMFMVPPVLFLGAALIFIWGYMPRKAQISLIEPERIEKELQSLIKRRRCVHILGFPIFVLGVAVGAWFSLK